MRCSRSSLKTSTRPFLTSQDVCAKTSSAFSPATASRLSLVHTTSTAAALSTATSRHRLREPIPFSIMGYSSAFALGIGQGFNPDIEGRLSTGASAPEICPLLHRLYVAIKEGNHHEGSCLSKEDLRQVQSHSPPWRRSRH